MAFINKSAKEIQVKIVYYGPGRCGKTTNSALRESEDECEVHG